MNEILCPKRCNTCRTTLSQPSNLDAYPDLDRFSNILQLEANDIGQGPRVVVSEATFCTASSGRLFVCRNDFKQGS